jgi:hypothetical protein
MTIPAFAAPLISPESLSLASAVADEPGVPVDVAGTTELVVDGVVVGVIVATTMAVSVWSDGGRLMTDGYIVGNDVSAPCLRFILGGLSGDAAPLLSA